MCAGGLPQRCRIAATRTASSGPGKDRPVTVCTDVRDCLPDEREARAQYAAPRLLLQRLSPTLARQV